MPKECKQLVLQNVWRTCNKIRAAIFRSGLNLWDIYKPLDRNNVCLISESKFVSVLNGPLKKLIGLSDQEVCDLADYFKVQDGRILYTQFCSVIQNEGNTDLAKNKPLVTGLEWDDPYHVNVLSMSEERRLKLLLTKMATTVSSRRLLLRPYFQDYELVAKNNGSVTLAHFSRILCFLKIYVSDEDYYLLKKKYLKDGYTINYVAFLAALDGIIDELQQRGIYDVGGDLLSQFPGRILTAELPKLPRPEIGNIQVDKVFGVQTVFHPILNQAPLDKSLKEVILRLQRYVFTERVRIGEFFKDFDKLNCGRVIESVFRRCLEVVSVGESGVKRFYMSPREIDSLINLYRDPNDPTRIMWRVFEADIDSVFSSRGLEKWPDAKIECPPSEVKKLPKVGDKWNEIDQPLRDKCEETIELVKRKVGSRRLALRPPFNDLDKTRNGHVSRRQFRTILISNNVILTDQQFYSLEQRYNDDMGFNYFKFLNEIDPDPETEKLFETYLNARRKLSEKVYKPPVQDRERNIVDVLAKIKKNIVCYRISLKYFMSQYDPNRQFTINENDFRRSLDVKLELTPTEIDTIIEVFRSTGRPGHVDYQRFCDVVEEAFTQKELHRAPLVQPFHHIPSTDAEHNFLNFEDRHAVSTALHKIATKEFRTLYDFYKALDKNNMGTVEESDVLRGLASICLHTLLSPKEITVVQKCFSKIKGNRSTFDYKEFIHAAEIAKTFIKASPI